jgi:hypothetical protein
MTVKYGNYKVKITTKDFKITSWKKEVASIILDACKKLSTEFELLDGEGFEVNEDGISIEIKKEEVKVSHNLIKTWH